ncbi:hypothetical protein CDL12_19251 [Handroanthus impetiginosus]|uniref:Post-GPI attachment to proteins factor 3 n=1 Tax=Handroanthus impetiginosus TaxID=429701 RepID=A0A2G9GS92_9LAMI|nr:hypothetical protein CDL12_19251 [Handroanthus impetiginosus]
MTNYYWILCLVVLSCLFKEPVSVAFSALNLAMHFHCWRSYSYLLYFSLPLQRDKKPFYDYSSMWKIYGLLSMNSWFWSAVFHSRDTYLTRNLDYSSMIAVLGFSLFLAILRSLDLKNDASKVMVAAPLIAFTTTHILYLNNYKLDYEWNTKVCVIMTIMQLFIWAIWAGVTRHPSRLKLWAVVVGSCFAMFLRTFDFPPYKGLIDAHALWQASTIPLTYYWWSFVKDDAEFRTANLLKKVR